MKKLFFLSMILSLLWLTACGGSSEPAASDLEPGESMTVDQSEAPTLERPLNVVTTTGMINDIVQNVGGDLINVQGLLGPGSDPHLYVASAGDVDKLQEADVIFYNGLFLEAQMEDILEQLGERKTVVPVSAEIDPDRLLASPQYADEFDPHIWFDVTLWQEAVRTVANTLSEVDPANVDTYQTNATEYLAELGELQQYVVDQANRVPEQQRVLVTAHDAFSYFGRAYGFEVLGLQGISTASEASTSDVQDLADYIAENEIPAIFVESSVPVRNVEAVQAAVQDRGFDVVIGGELFSDAMGSEGSAEGTYIGMVRHNIDTIVGALLGESASE